MLFACKTHNVGFGINYTTPQSDGEEMIWLEFRKEHGNCEGYEEDMGLKGFERVKDN